MNTECLNSPELTNFQAKGIQVTMSYSVSVILFFLPRERAYRTVAQQLIIQCLFVAAGTCLASNGLPSWLHYSGFQASCHNISTFTINVDV
jgi:hypothetical protein